MKKRGISPLIATILLIGIVIVLGIVIFNWIGVIFDEQIGQTEDMMQLYMTNSEFEFDCSYDFEANFMELKLRNKYNLEIPSFFVVFNDSSTETYQVDLGAYETQIIAIDGKVSDSLDVTPQIEIDGKTESLIYKKITEDCVEMLPMPACSNGQDDDDDGSCDYEGCLGFPPDPDCISPEDDDESGTLSLTSCDDPDFLADGALVLADDILTSDLGNCFTFENEEDFTLDCNGHVIDGENGGATDGSIGIYIGAGSNEINILDCEVTGFEAGVLVGVDGGSQISEVYIQGGKFYGNYDGIRFGDGSNINDYSIVDSKILNVEAYENNRHGIIFTGFGNPVWGLSNNEISGIYACDNAVTAGDGGGFTVYQLSDFTYGTGNVFSFNQAGQADTQGGSDWPMLGQDYSDCP